MHGKCKIVLFLYKLATRDRSFKVRDGVCFSCFFVYEYSDNVYSEIRESFSPIVLFHKYFGKSGEFSLFLFVDGFEEVFSCKPGIVSCFYFDKYYGIFFSTDNVYLTKGATPVFE